ncbi:hypothetical protein C2857_003139 [Epichloe festucae Fl1]|uniref:Phosphoribulokinase/uridine kinase domain-containing protein n=1 Tax=Epichloe festucae (strain Fl1) TaxID=877507 RepID=A0A7S9PWU8_EPIFF|nr:hypothetical protein C2857_003139 [Epichloe festucae Fl1]
MDSQIGKLVEKAWAKYSRLSPGQRLLIGVGGIPGSGKTTLSRIVSQRLNLRASEAQPSHPPPATYVPMDGFHLTREALSAMPDPETAHARRGAAFTFDAAKFLSLVEELRAPIPSRAILAPSFDHAVKDPKEDDVSVLPTHRIVILEGNYLALDKDVWRDAASLFDELWFVQVDFEVARKRLRERHVRAGIAKTVEEGDRRAVENDLVNGGEITKYRLAVDEVVQSREDGSWVHEC